MYNFTHDCYRDLTQREYRGRCGPEHDTDQDLDVQSVIGVSGVVRETLRPNVTKMPAAEETTCDAHLA
jgi:hypothetical protein